MSEHEEDSFGGAASDATTVVECSARTAGLQERRLSTSSVPRFPGTYGSHKTYLSQETDWAERQTTATRTTPTAPIARRCRTAGTGTTGPTPARSAAPAA